MATTNPQLADELVGTDPTTIRTTTNRMLLWRCENHPEPFPAKPGSRLQGKRCGYCHGSKVLPGFNDMATTHPVLAGELVDSDPKTVRAGTKQKLLWRCTRHSQPYRASGSERLRGVGCNICAGKLILVGFNDLATTHPDLAKELVDTDPTSVTAGSKKKLLWRCPNHAEPFSATVSHRAQGTNCPYCSGTAVLTGFNDMATTHPDLAAELVGIDPTMTRTQTAETLYWRCANHPEPYPATGAQRHRGSSCGYCGNKRLLVGFNDLASRHPDLAKQLVDRDPTTVIAGTDEVLLWRCPNHDEPFPKKCWERIKGLRCGYCSGRRLLPGFNDLQTRFPQVAAELVSADPSTLMPGSTKRQTWLCPAGHKHYEASPNNRTKPRGRGCPACRRGGFRPADEAIIYLMERPGEQQIGITGNRKQRFYQHASRGWRLLDETRPMLGYVAKDLEWQIKCWLKAEIGALPGTTEAWSTANFEVTCLSEVAEASGVDLPAP